MNFNDKVYDHATLGCVVLEYGEVCTRQHALTTSVAKVNRKLCAKHAVQLAKEDPLVLRQLAFRMSVFGIDFDD